MPIYLCLGSNLGDRKLNISRAVKELENSGLKILKRSPLYETEPVGIKAQPMFINMCLEAGTPLDPEALLNVIKQVETKIGREKGEKWGPRIIDIDILFYNNIIIHGENLTIPHPEIINRKFVLDPMNEIAPGFVHPEYNLTIKELLEKKDFIEKTRKLGK